MARGSFSFSLLGGQSTPTLVITSDRSLRGFITITSFEDAGADVTRSGEGLGNINTPITTKALVPVTVILSSQHDKVSILTENKVKFLITGSIEGICTFEANQVTEFTGDISSAHNPHQYPYSETYLTE